MATFRVIKAHDGLQVGALKELPASPITDYMVQNGYWEIADNTKKEKPKKSKKK